MSRTNKTFYESWFCCNVPNCQYMKALFQVFGKEHLDFFKMSIIRKSLILPTFILLKDIYYTTSLVTSLVSYNVWTAFPFVNDWFNDVIIFHVICRLVLSLTSLKLCPIDQMNWKPSYNIMMWLWQKEVIYNSLVPRIHAEINITHNFTGLRLQQQLHIGVRWLFEVNKYTTNILHTRGKLVPHFRYLIEFTQQLKLQTTHWELFLRKQTTTIPH